ncbi:aminodeoxychorismate lyase [Vagococcus elongatus]|uniref:Endolytic murein transglycosylase n=2 Tax=Vagococcus elongatus TaxID=180344 RepID=A0A430B255_9ENTE|nr:aminodeoxychorismate lyase [Vagococcus elongatus]
MRRRSERKKENKLVGKIVLAVITALVVTVAIVGISFYRYWQAGLKPLNPKDDQLVQVNIPIGSSNKSIGSILEEEKVIKSGMVFTYYMKTENITDFKAGYYQMSPNMTLDEIAVLLQQGGTKEPEALADARVSIPEGYSADQIAELFADKTKIKKEEFLDVLKDESFFEELYQDYGKLLESAKKAQDVRYRLEGYLFPATYNYYKEKSIKDMIREMVDKTNSELAARQESLDQSGMTTQQVLTLASLVEKEGVEKEDRRNIAQVFLNRIKADMPLQSDISVLYAMEKHKVHLSNKDTEIDSPYNLYINKGFGPGPFNNPGIEAIDAVLNPEPNTYYYFLANIETHKVYFAETYEEHLILKEEHIDNQIEE